LLRDKFVKPKRFILAFVAVAGCILLALWNSREPKSPTVAVVKPAPIVAPSPVVETPPPAAPQSQENVAVVSVPVKEAAVQPKPEPQAQAPQPATPAAKEPLHDPDARSALAFVGADPEAEQYWLDAIFDTNLPDKEREDLMEDLNEVGFADPKNLTADDLPLIANRLQIIEELLPGSDDFMTEHLMEAYKDLNNMYARVAGQ
jgi:hypothetical protein